MSNCPQSHPNYTGTIRGPEDGSVAKQQATGGSPMTRGETSETSETPHPPKIAPADGATDVAMSAYQSASHQNQHDQKTCPECLSKAQCPFAPAEYPKCETLSASTYGQALSSPHIGHALSIVARDLEAYEPLTQWKEEKLREQPWHGIARELMSDEWSENSIADGGRAAE